MDDETKESNQNCRLKPYATKDNGQFVKRQKELTKPLFRTDFQRDKDRIIHSKSFRRLEYKSQVYLSQQGDHLRTRLTHTLEVAQLARTIGLNLGLNVDLCEAIALGHDLGHTPFGHAGERKLSEKLNAYGYRFKHNVQSIRVVDSLEKKYDYAGLNLTMAVREGILKHTKVDYSDDYSIDLEGLHPEKEFSVTLEGQVVAISDEIAQATHDLDDFLRFNLIELGNMLDFEFLNYLYNFTLRTYEFDLLKKIKSFNDDQLEKDYLIRCLVDMLVSELIIQTNNRLKNKNDLVPFFIDNVYIKFDDDFHASFIKFKKEVHRIIFDTQKVAEMDIRGAYIVDRLFESYSKYPNLMPKETLKKYENEKADKRILVIANHIAGMTDRYAIKKFDELIEL